MEEVDEDAQLALAIAKSMENVTLNEPSNHGMSSNINNVDQVEQEELDRAIALSLQDSFTQEGRKPAVKENEKDPPANTLHGPKKSLLGSIFSMFGNKHLSNESLKNYPGSESNTSNSNNSQNTGLKKPPTTSSSPKPLIPDTKTQSVPSPSAKPSAIAHEDNLCPRCGQFVSKFSRHFKAAGHFYHDDCFRCFGCQQRFLPPGASGSVSFAVHDGLPYHASCSHRLFAQECAVCHHPMEGQYYVHPFFSDFKYCLSHEDTQPSCFSCRRKEPIPDESHSDHFVTLPDNRKLCPACCETVVMESAELKVLYEEVLNFFISELSLPVPPEMFDIPILAVDIFSLNEHLLKEQQEGVFDISGHFDSSNNNNDFNNITNNTHLTVGLTMSTIGSVRYFQPKRNFLQNQGYANLFANNGIDFSETMQLFKQQTTTQVTGILILFGLPHDYTASIIAHEAFHAYMRLSPQFQYNTHAVNSNYSLPQYLQSSPTVLARQEAGKLAKTGYPPIVEEGLCQLIAYKYLEFLSKRCQSTMSSLKTGHSASTLNNIDSQQEATRAEQFREYCRYRIREDRNPIYGEGFRRAKVMDETISLPVLLEYVATNRDF